VGLYFIKKYRAFTIGLLITYYYYYVMQLKCKCEKQWEYKGANKFHATCPDCKKAVKIIEVE